MTHGIQTLDELLSDPIIRMLMVRDHVRADEIRRLLQQARSRAVRVPAPHVIDQTKEPVYRDA